MQFTFFFKELNFWSPNWTFEVQNHHVKFDGEITTPVITIDNITITITINEIKKKSPNGTRTRDP